MNGIVPVGKKGSEGNRKKGTQLFCGNVQGGTCCRQQTKDPSYPAHPTRLPAGLAQTSIPQKASGSTAGEEGGKQHTEHLAQPLTLCSQEHCD